MHTRQAKEKAAHEEAGFSAPNTLPYEPSKPRKRRRRKMKHGNYASGNHLGSIEDRKMQEDASRSVSVSFISLLLADGYL